MEAPLQAVTNRAILLPGYTRHLFPKLRFLDKLVRYLRTGAEGLTTKERYSLFFVGALKGLVSIAERIHSPLVFGPNFTCWGQ